MLLSIPIVAFYKLQRHCLTFEMFKEVTITIYNLCWLWKSYNLKPDIWKSINCRVFSSFLYASPLFSNDSKENDIVVKLLVAIHSVSLSFLDFERRIIWTRISLKQLIVAHFLLSLLRHPYSRMIQKKIISLSWDTLLSRLLSTSYPCNFSYFQMAKM